MPIYQ